MKEFTDSMACAEQGPDFRDGNVLFRPLVKCPECNHSVYVHYPDNLGCEICNLREDLNEVVTVLREILKTVPGAQVHEGKELE